MEKLTAREKKIARILQFEIPTVSRPFREIGTACGFSEEEVLDITKYLREEGYIRRFGVILRHQKAGFTTNALVIWQVPADQIDQAGKTLATFSFVSHCYERKPAFQNKYNLFTMVHTQIENIAIVINQMANSINNHDFLILESIQEYKKISPEYF